MVQRIKIPKRIEAQILYDNDHTCCICRSANKHVQVHHADANPKNNAFSNLVVLCLDCHAKVSVKGGLGRKYSVMEVLRYKRNWEFLVRKRRAFFPTPEIKSNAATVAVGNDVRRYVYEFVVTDNVGREGDIGAA
jgi:hypothetical protein